MASIDRLNSRSRVALEPDDEAIEAARAERAEQAAAAAAATQAAAAAAEPQAATQTTSAFQEPASTPATAAATTAPPVAEAVAAARTTEFHTSVGSGTTKAADLVRNDTQVDAIVQAAKPDEAAAVRAHFEKASTDDVKQAFTNVLEATSTQGTKPVTIGPFVGSVTVDAAGAVNGAPLASDKEVLVGSRLVHVSHDDRKAALRQYGVDEQRLNQLDEAAVRTAFNNAELRRQVDGPGQGSIDLPRVQVGRGSYPATTVSFEVADGGQLVKNGAPVKAATEAALERIAETESKEWPGGTPEARLRTRIEDVALEVTKNDKVNTIAQALPEAEAARFRSVVATHPGVSEGSLTAAYQQVLDARKTPGSKTLDVSLTQMKEETWYGGEGETGTSVVEGAAVSFRGPMEVGADGSVNGKRLEVDELARLSSQISTVPAEAKEAALKEAGLDDNWLGQASQPQKDMALAKLRHATMTPGEKNVDLSFSMTVTSGGESETTSTYTVPGSLKLNVDAQGKVNGKTPSLETALATTLTFERMPMVEKRLMLGQLGVGADGLKNVTPNEASDILTRVALRTKTPGDQQFDISVGGKTWVMGLKVGAKGEIEGAGAMEKPQPPKQKWYKKWLGPILTIASFVFPPAAPFLQAANAVLAIKNGAKGLGLVAAVAGAVAGVGNIAGFSSVASVASTVANVAGAANGIHQGIKTGNFLGAISSIVSLAGQVGGLTNTDLGSNWNMVETAGKVAGYASKVVSGDIAGLVTDGVGAAISHHQSTTAASTKTEVTAETAEGSSTDFSLGTARLGESGTSTVRLGTGDDGSSMSTTLNDEDSTTTSTASQGDVRRIDNEIDRTRPQTREDFNRAFAGARANGERTFSFDMNDGRGPQQYTTGTREEVAASVPGGSTAGYRRFLTDTGMRDSDSSLTAYRAAVAPRPATVFPDTQLTGVIDAPPGFSMTGETFASASQGTGSNGVRVTNGTETGNRVTPANTGSDLLDSLIDRVNTIGVNLGTVARGTTWDSVTNGARSAYDAAVAATSRGIEYVAETSGAQMRQDAANLADRAVTAVRNDPAGAAWAAVNAVVPVGDIYRGVERLGDRELSYAEAAAATAQAGFGIAGVVGVGAGGSAIGRTARVADDVGDASRTAGRVADELVDASTPPVRVDPPFVRNAEELERARLAIQATEVPTGYYPLEKPSIGQLYNAESLSPSLRAGYQQLFDLTYDAPRMIERVQELERRVQTRVADTGVPTTQALELELAAMESRNGFRQAIDLEPKLYGDDEWKQLLASGTPFRDRYFDTSGVHGVNTHRIQYWAVMREMELNPQQWANVTPLELWTNIGTSNVGSGTSLWTKAFDTVDVYSTSYAGFFDKNAGLFPGLGVKP